MARGRSTAVRLARRARTNQKLDWAALLEELCQLVTAAERDGQEPAVVLRKVPARPETPKFDVLGITFPKEHPSSLFGPGDGLKSYLTLYIANEQARRGIKVALFDWELDENEHRQRQARIDPEMPDLLYVKCSRPLVHELDRLRRIVRRERIEYGHFDSAAFGTDGKPEDAVSAMAYFRALRQLGIGCNVIAHSRREDGDAQPFGSVFYHNSFRATWNIKRASTSADGMTVTLGAFCRKFNLGPPPPATGISVTFDGDRVYFTRTDVATIEELADHVPLWQRMQAALRGGPLTLAEIGKELSCPKVGSIDRTVRRHKTLFTRVSGPDGIARIALVERRLA